MFRNQMIWRRFGFTNLFARGTALALLCLLALSPVGQSHAQPTPPNRIEDVTLQLKWRHQFQFAGYYAAQQQDFYRDAGLNVTIVEARDNQNPIASVVNGEAEYGVGTSELVLWRSRGEKVVVLAVIFQHSPLVLLTPRDSGIESLHEMVGKQVAIEENSAELLAYLQDEGISPDAIEIVPHPFSPTVMLDGTVDAMSAYSSDEPFVLREAGVSYQTFTPRSAGIDFYGDVLFTTEAHLAQNPEQVQAFVDATMQGWKYAFAHEDELIDYIYDDLTQRHSREHLRFEADQMRRLIQPDLIEPGYMYEGRWRYIIETYARVGLIPQPFPAADLLYAPNSTADLRPLYTGLAAALGVILLVGGILLRFYRLNTQLRRQIDEREKAQAQLEESEERYRSLVEAAPFPVVISRLEDGTIRYLNPRAESLLRLNRGEAIGKPAVSLYVHPQDRSRMLEQLRAQQQVSDFEVMLHSTDGREFGALLSSIIMQYQGEPAIFVTFQDTTERKRAESQAFALAIEQERVKVLSAFIQNASHEFRTPLAIIGSSMYLLNRAENAEQRQRHIEKAETQIKHIAHLIEILTTMTRLDSGAPLDTKPLDLVELVDELVFTVRWEVRHQNVAMNVEMPPVRIMIQGDSEQLQAALRRLVENAQRYTPHGGSINITLTAAVEQHRAIIEIRDTGIGISEEAMPHIFERFWREDHAHTTPGFGIGLPFAQKVIAAHGGSIDVESEPSHGSIFRITLPIADLKDPEATP